MVGRRKERIPKKRRPTQTRQQMTLFDLDSFSDGSAAVAEKVKKEKLPATPLMKKVAEKAPSQRNMKKVFSKKEYEEILNKIDGHENVSVEERAAVKEQYRKIKRQVKELEKGNQSRVIAFPSLTNGSGWYKVADFSALYYVYRLADRMGRGANIYKDSDKFSKVTAVASFQNIEKFVKQFEELEHPRLDITEDGIYIFALEHPLTDDEVGALWRTEEVRRDKMHNVLRPKAMDPAAYQAILMVVRQVMPRIRKLDKNYSRAVGDDIARDIRKLLATYFKFADGLYERKEAGAELISIVDDLIAGVTTLAEVGAWKYDVSAVIGENINNIKRIVIKSFNVRSKE